MEKSQRQKFIKVLKKKSETVIALQYNIMDGGAFFNSLSEHCVDESLALTHLGPRPEVVIDYRDKVYLLRPTDWVTFDAANNIAIHSSEEFDALFDRTESSFSTLDLKNFIRKRKTGYRGTITEKDCIKMLTDFHKLFHND